MKPYYETELGKLYHGDCLDILPQLTEKVDAVITDPVWPKHRGMFGDIDAAQLLADSAALWNCERCVIVMRNDQDPRILTGIPYPFLQVMWLRYAAVGYLGRFLTGNEAAYAFGKWPSSKPGRHVLPAMGPVQTTPVKNGHPCPRSETHFIWLVNNWGDGLVLDPFAGSCTTAVAAEKLGRRWIMIELSEQFCEIGAKRIEQERSQMKLCL